MRMILLGPPGAGKGTQAVRLSERYGIAHVATGDLFRHAIANETPIGKKAKAYMDAGDLVPDGVVLELILERLHQPDAANGFLLDGFPRNPAQAEQLKDILAETGAKIDAVVSLEVADDIIVQRLSSRGTCPVCQKPFPFVAGEHSRCPNDGAELIQRGDDKPDVIRRRLEVFHEQTAPLIEYYGTQGCLVRIDGVGDIEDVESRIAKEVDARA